jgi:hypothetical protein
MTLKRTQDRKTANLSNAAGKQSVIANAFSLPSGQEFSCPGATSICEKVCYAGKLEKIYKGFRAVVIHNWEMLKDLSAGAMIEHLSEMIDAFRADCDKRNADKAFRIHADGDFFSSAYAIAWKSVIVNNPDIQFWVYTRSFTERLNVVPILADIPNLSLYLSVDADNRESANSVIAEYPSVRVAMLADTMAEAGELIQAIRDTNRPGAKCPENIKQIPLIDNKGGACFSCNLCVAGKADVRFAIKKK